MNIVTLRDINLLLLVDKFLEEFIGYYCTSLIDFFLGYNQLTLYLKSRDITMFDIPLRLL